MKYSELLEELQSMSPEQLDQVVVLFSDKERTVRKIELYYENGDALLEGGNPFFLC